MTVHIIGNMIWFLNQKKKKLRLKKKPSGRCSSGLHFAKEEPDVSGCFILNSFTLKISSAPVRIEGPCPLSVSGKVPAHGSVLTDSE